MYSHQHLNSTLPSSNASSSLHPHHTSAKNTHAHSKPITKIQTSPTSPPSYHSNAHSNTIPIAASFNSFSSFNHSNPQIHNLTNLTNLNNTTTNIAFITDHAYIMKSKSKNSQVRLNANKENANNPKDIHIFRSFHSFQTVFFFAFVDAGVFIFTFF